MTVELNDPGSSDVMMGWGLLIFVLVAVVPVTRIKVIMILRRRYIIEAYPF
jgi:hypothetical protein